MSYADDTPCTRREIPCIHEAVRPAVRNKRAGYAHEKRHVMHATPGAGVLREKRPGIVTVLRIQTTRRAHTLVFRLIPGLFTKKKRPDCPQRDQQVKGLRAELEGGCLFLRRIE